MLKIENISIADSQAKRKIIGIFQNQTFSSDQLKTSTKAEAECYHTDKEKKTLVTQTQQEIWPTLYRP